MNKNLLILGAGQYGTVVKEIAKSMDFFSQIDVLDENEFDEKIVVEYAFILPFSEETKKLARSFQDKFVKLSVVKDNEIPLVYKGDPTKSPSEYNFDEVM